MMLTTTISVNSMHMTSSVVTVPIPWMYITAVVVIIPPYCYCSYYVVYITVVVVIIPPYCYCSYYVVVYYGCCGYNSTVLLLFLLCGCILRLLWL